jgi:UDP-N-acetylglucosamine acyltransferase
MSIHPTAIIEAGAQLGAGCEVHAHAIIKKHTVLGAGVVVHSFAVIGGDPQFLKFDPATISGVHLGAGTIVREHVTINRSIHAGQATRIGARCFLMASAHVGHDCVVADEVVLANNVMLAGHVEIGGFTFVGGGAGIHQFVRIGEGVMVSGLTRLTRDVAPFLMVAERDEVPGFNVVGFKRRGFSREAIHELKACYRAVFAGGDPRRLAATVLAAGVTSAEARCFLDFFAAGKRGFVRPTGSLLRKDEHAG